MQGAVNYEVSQFPDGTYSVIHRLPLGLWEGYDYLAQWLGYAGRQHKPLVVGGLLRPVTLPMPRVVGGKGQDVGGLVQPPVCRVQFPDRLIAGDEQADLRISLHSRCGQRRSHCRLEPLRVDLAFVRFVDRDQGL